MRSSMGMMSIKPQLFKRFEWPKINRLRGKTPLTLACNNAVLKPGFDFGHILSTPNFGRCHENNFWSFAFNRKRTSLKVSKDQYLLWKKLNQNRMSPKIIPDENSAAAFQISFQPILWLFALFATFLFYVCHDTMIKTSLVGGRKGT